MATLTDNIPQAGNTGLGDILKMEDNFEMYNLFLKGYLQRSKFAYASTTSITVDPGIYDHNGSARQCCYWNAALTFVLGPAGSNAASSAIGTSCWQYIYIDDSAVVTAATNLLTAAELLNSTTAPTYSDTKKGFYNGLDRCIFFVYIDSSGHVKEFYHDGTDYVRVIGVPVASATNLTTSFANSPEIYYPIPLCTQIECLVGMFAPSSGDYATVYVRPGGSSDATGDYLGFVGYSQACANLVLTLRLIPDGSGYVQFIGNTMSGTIVVQTRPLGYYLRGGI